MSKTDMNVNFGQFSPFILVKWFLIFLFLCVLFFRGDPDLSDSLIKFVDACTERVIGDSEVSKPLP